VQVVPLAHGKVPITTEVPDFLALGKMTLPKTSTGPLLKWSEASDFCEHPPAAFPEQRLLLGEQLLPKTLMRFLSH
jgi:hypothetical protein